MKTGVMSSLWGGGLATKKKKKKKTRSISIRLTVAEILFSSLCLSIFLISPQMRRKLLS